MFRHQVETGALGVLRQIGFTGEVRAALIGVPRSGSGAILTFERTDNMYSKNLRRAFWDLNFADIDPLVTGMGWDGSGERPDSLFGQAVESHLNSHPRGARWRYFVHAESAPIGELSIYVALAVDAAAIEAVPCFHRERINGTLHNSSLVTHAIDQILRRSWLHLVSEPAAYGIVSLSIQKFEIIRSATVAFVGSVLDPTGLHGKRDSDLLLSSISALPYEGRSGQGAITLAEPGSDGLKIHVHLVDPVDLGNVGAVRKLLEAVADRRTLLVREGAVYGIGEMRSAGSAVGIDFLGRGAWRLRQGDVGLMQVKDGLCTLPAPTDIDVETLEKLVAWLVSDADLDALVAFADAARKNDHGAMLVISADAAEEARRLAPQAWMIHPAVLANEVVSDLTGMDGGFLVDPQGRCHAIGVILDGVAAGVGNPGRGSRYNNPLRYLGTRRVTTDAIPNAIVIVFSADGSIDMLPPYPRGIDRAHLALLVDRVTRHAGADGPDTDELLADLRLLRNEEFYLSRDQCDRVNEALERVRQSYTDMEWPRAADHVFRPDPRMDEGRFLR